MWYNTTTLAYSYHPINCKVASALIKQAYDPYPPVLAGLVQPSPSAGTTVAIVDGGIVDPSAIANSAQPPSAGGGSVPPKGQPIPPRLQPGPADTPLTRKEVKRMLNKALRKRPPGMGFGGGLMWAALASLGGVLLDRLLSSGGKKHEPSYYAPYIPGYRLY